MTEEQLKAKSNAILDKLEEDGFDLGDWSIEDAHNNGFIDGYHECQKEREWHDLRKNPNDLPKEVGNYIVCFLDTDCERHTFELTFVDYFEDIHWIDEDNHNIEGYDEGVIGYDENVIAWCEIPTFDKE